MALDRSDVEKIAHLASLGLSDVDLPHITSALNSILGLVNEMQAVNTDGIEPLAHPLEASQRTRADVVTESNNRDAYQSIAPAVENGLYLVPKVID
ncbi:Asp-tRNA(Asn)/Glu-tRNA(Gln) amidotransferase subunit GatC [Pseudomonas orientalis]|uniref:Aspartyl/glutamyl-tRNA(Asn/Gln) amidotransferase subunit C n=1 Tax=Pseudomonas orientalis TaxID=76758 RepID=A0A1H2HC56_9PSED|nr:Asp-tRNA(Asn)/Glu-tRNA(Gln) amidotransferase subunit GatC [Pseudomonas orientalis]KRP61060.1 glutamyl-tRNA amidotransferase [Pseudomonas orientalis]SDU29118.1 aspartyl/glutamyl-tRNA(Asn/Gln) amidotransferase subunit C [Pseudomonas orientalis]